MYFFPNIDERTGVEFIASGITVSGDVEMHAGYAVYPSLRLDDGTVLRNVQVDADIDEQFQRSLGDPNALYVVQKIFTSWVIYAIESEGQLVTGRLKGFDRKRYQSAAMIAILAAGSVVAHNSGGEIGTVLFVIAVALTVTACFHFSQLGSMLRSATQIRQVRTLNIV